MEHLTKSYPKVIGEFNRKAKTYSETHSRKNTTIGMHEKLRRRLVETLVQGRGNLLDIGCGTGWYLKRFSDRFSCYGIDISFGMLKECKENNLNICLANGEIIPFKNNTFDCVLCVNMFQYIDRPLTLFGEIRRIIKENGILIFDFKNKLSLRSMIHSLNNRSQNLSEFDLEKRYSIFDIFNLLYKTNWIVCKCLGTEFDCFQTSLKPKPPSVINFFELVDVWLGRSLLKYFSGRVLIAVK